MAEHVVVIGDRALEVEVVPSLGARVHRIRAFGHDLLRTAPSVGELRADPIVWGGYFMAPWCNRAPAGPITIGGRTLELEPSFADGTAIHGLVHDQPWHPDGDRAWRIDVPAGRWPWAFGVRVAYEVADTRLIIDLAVENHADGTMPAGVGWHPWFLAPVELSLPAATVFESNIDSGGAVPVHGPFDRRDPGPLAEAVDATWTDLDPAAVTLEWPDTRVRASLSMSPSLRYVAAAAIPGLGAVAVEPQTHAPDGLRRRRDGEPHPIPLLAPGATLAARIELTVEQG